MLEREHESAKNNLVLPSIIKSHLCEVGMCHQECCSEIEGEKTKYFATLAGLEPTWSYSKGFQVRRLNHSATES